MSESSEDNESNTSPPDHSSSPTLTSDPTSDSSDAGGMSNTSNGDNSNLSSELQDNDDGSTDHVGKNESPSMTSIHHQLDQPETIQGSNSNNSRAGGSGAMCSSSSKDKESMSACFQKVYTKAKSKNKLKSSSKEKMSDVDSGVSSSHFSADKPNVSTFLSHVRVHMQHNNQTSTNYFKIHLMS
jgi:hypothetical protein